MEQQKGRKKEDLRNKLVATRTRKWGKGGVGRVKRDAKDKRANRECVKKRKYH